MKENILTTKNTEGTEIKEKNLSENNSSFSVSQCIQWLNSFII
jgi:hypothetical protein